MVLVDFTIIRKEVKKLVTLNTIRFFDMNRTWVNKYESLNLTQLLNGQVQIDTIFLHVMF